MTSRHLRRLRPHRDLPPILLLQAATPFEAVSAGQAGPTYNQPIAESACCGADAVSAGRAGSTCNHSIVEGCAGEAETLSVGQARPSRCDDLPTQRKRPRCEMICSSVESTELQTPSSSSGDLGLASLNQRDVLYQAAAEERAFHIDVWPPLRWRLRRRKVEDLLRLAEARLFGGAEFADFCPGGKEGPKCHHSCQDYAMEEFRKLSRAEQMQCFRQCILKARRRPYLDRALSWKYAFSLILPFIGNVSTVVGEVLILCQKGFAEKFRLLIADMHHFRVGGRDFAACSNIIQGPRVLRYQSIRRLWKYCVRELVAKTTLQLGPCAVNQVYGKLPKEHDVLRAGSCVHMLQGCADLPGTSSTTSSAKSSSADAPPGAKLPNEDVRSNVVKSFMDIFSDFDLADKLEKALYRRAQLAPDCKDLIMKYVVTAHNMEYILALGREERRRLKKGRTSPQQFAANCWTKATASCQTGRHVNPSARRKQVHATQPVNRRHACSKKSRPKVVRYLPKKSHGVEVLRPTSLGVYRLVKPNPVTEALKKKEGILYIVDINKDPPVKDTKRMGLLWGQEIAGTEKGEYIRVRIDEKQGLIKHSQMPRPASQALGHTGIKQTTIPCISSQPSTPISHSSSGQVSASSSTWASMQQGRKWTTSRAPYSAARRGAETKYVDLISSASCSSSSNGCASRKRRHDGDYDSARDETLTPPPPLLPYLQSQQVNDSISGSSSSSRSSAYAASGSWHQSWNPMGFEYSVSSSHARGVGDRHHERARAGSVTSQCKRSRTPPHSRSKVRRQPQARETVAITVKRPDATLMPSTSQFQFELPLDFLDSINGSILCGPKVDRTKKHPDVKMGRMVRKLQRRSHQKAVSDAAQLRSSRKGAVIQRTYTRVYNFYGIEEQEESLSHLRQAMAQHWWALLCSRVAIGQTGFQHAEIVATSLDEKYTRWMEKPGRTFCGFQLLRHAHIHNPEAKDDTRNAMLMKFLQYCESDGRRAQLAVLANTYNGHGLVKALEGMKAERPAWYAELVETNNVHGLAAYAWSRRIQLFSARYRPLSIRRFALNKEMRNGHRQEWFCEVKSQAQKLFSLDKSTRLLQSLRDKETVIGQYQLICDAMGLVYRALPHDALLACKNLLQILHAYQLLAPPDSEEEYPQCVGSNFCLKLGQLDSRAWQTLLKEWQPPVSAFKVQNSLTSEVQTVSVAPEITPELVQYWNCMFGRILRATLCNCKLPSALKRNAEHEAEDKRCGEENQDQMSLDDLYDVFRQQG